MSEDYTYDAPVDWRKRAEAAERERDELRARLAAVPVEEISKFLLCWINDDKVNVETADKIERWLNEVMI